MTPSRNPVCPARISGVKRRLFTVLAGVSLLLCAATMAMWARSYWRREWVGLYLTAQYNVHKLMPSGGVHIRVGGYDRSHLLLGSLRGLVYVQWKYPTSIPTDPHIMQWRWPHHSDTTVNVGSPSWKYLGFYCENLSDTVQVVIPYWFVLLVAGYLSGRWVFASRKLRRQGRAFRQANNLCLNCGYDLRATPDRCPECGVVPERREINAP